MKTKLKPWRLCLPILMFFMLLSSINVEASHFRYGSVSWQEVDGAPAGTVKFKIALSWRKTYFATVGAVGNVVNVGTFSYGDGSTAPINLTVTSINAAEDWFYGETTLTKTYSASQSSYLAFFTDCCRISTLANAPDAQYRIETRVTPFSGNNSPVSTITPIINLQTGLSNASFFVPATDPDGEALTYRLSTPQEMFGAATPNNPAGLTVNSTTGLVTFNTVGRPVGQLNAVSVTIQDGTSKISADFIIKIVQQSTPPVFDYAFTPMNATIIQVSPGQPVSFPVVAKDVDPGSTVTLTGVGLPIGSTVSPAFPTTGNPVQSNFHWTPTTSQLGTTVINFTATDNNGVQANTSVSIIVSMNPKFDVPPTPDGLAAIVTEPNHAVSFPLQASDPDPNDVVRIISATPMPAGASFSVLPSIAGNPTSTNFTWTPPVSSWGENVITFTAKDSYNDIGTHDVKILVNTTPVFTSTPVTQVKAGQLYSYLITGVDPDVAFGDVLEVASHHVLPSWLTLTDNHDGTALLSGTPSLADVGEYHIGLELEDLYHHVNVGGAPEQEFEIEVLPCNLSLAANVTDVTCKSLSNGAIDLSVSNANLPVAITWSTGEASEDVSGLSAGLYNVIVTDVYGCSDTLDITVKQPDTLITSIIATPETCPGSANGTLNLISSGGTAPFTIVWSDGKTGPIDANVTSGSYSVSVTDGNGCSANAVASVTHADNINPIAIAKDITINLDANGSVKITADDINNGSNDNCGISSISIDKETFNCMNIGANTVVLLVTDVAGNIATATATVTVVDAIAPTVKAKNIALSLDANGTALIIADDVNDGSIDNCSSVTLSLNKASFDCSNVGDNTVILTGTDASGNMSSATAVVTISDNTAPTAKAKDITVTLNASGSAIITPSDINNGSSDNCAIVSMTLDKSTFDCSNAGNNTVTLVVTDAAGLTSSATAVVTVVDQTAPVALTKNVTVALNANGLANVSVNDINNNSYDNCSIASISLDKQSFNCSNVGVNTVVLTVKDAAGLSTSATAVVTVVDATAPVALTKNVTVSLNANGSASVSVNDINNSSYDNCSIASITLNKQSFDCSNVGVNTVILTVKDAAGLSTSATATVTVVDQIAPSISGITSITKGNDAGICGAIVALTSPSVSDNCSIASVKNNAPVIFPVGTTQVIWTVKDVNGNVSEASQYVTITNVSPVINTLTSTTAPTAINTTVSASATFTDNNLVSATWNWGNGQTTAGVISGNTITGSYKYPGAGFFTITLTVTDACGNTATKTTGSALVIFDTGAGIVTGGGWISLPSCNDKGNFSANAIYLPTGKLNGSTEFKVDNLNLQLKSTDLQWLVVVGNDAWLKGTATVNKVAGYEFIVGVEDNGITNDKFRIKIWNSATNAIVFDNEAMYPIEAKPQTVIGSGSIVIHKDNAGRFGNFENSELSLTAYPNPTSEIVYVSVPNESSATLMLYNEKGELLNVKEVSTSSEMFVDLHSYNSGVYVVKVTTAEKEYNAVKIIKK